jgi:hypothetical protein
MTVGLRNTRDGMVRREAPPKRPQRTKIEPCEQRQLLASAGCGTIGPGELGASLIRRFVSVNRRYHDSVR